MTGAEAKKFITDNHLTQAEVCTTLEIARTTLEAQLLKDKLSKRYEFALIHAVELLVSGAA
jgi:predicted XRE-type DNA-binding protein